MQDTSTAGNALSVSQIAESPILRILIFEDTSTDAELIESELRKAGLIFIAKCVETVEAFACALRDFLPDIILSDYNLPGFSGLAVLEIAKRDCPEMPVIIVTDALSDKEAVKLLQFGAQDYVFKDHLARVVPAVLHALLDKQGSWLRNEQKRNEEILLFNQFINDCSPDSILWIDEKARICHANNTACIEHGFTKDELLTMSLADIDPDISADMWPAHWQELKQKGTLNFESRHRRKDGSIFPVEINDNYIRFGGRELNIGFSRNITERKLAENALRLQSEITANAAEGISLVRTDGVIHYANHKFEELFGYCPGELAGKHISIINAPAKKNPQETVDEILQAIRERGAWCGEVLNVRKDGSMVWTSANVSTLEHPDLGTLLVSYQRDITERKKSEEMIWQHANFDALTGLPNRHMFHDRLVQEIRKADRARQKIALMFIDLDRFKEVNDTLGHDMGDILLVEAAHRINECVRTTDMVARMGGDEFTITLTDVADVGSVERVAQAILVKLAEPFHIGANEIFVSGSIGITLYPDDTVEIEELLKNADQAMYAAKSLGRNCHSYFTHKLQENARARLHLITDLRGALAANQFLVYFQPIVDMNTGAICKAEALIRWQHPDRGLVSPAEFIPLAEETGLIFEISDWVFNQSVYWVKRWREIYHPEFQVSINKSPVQLYKRCNEDLAWLAHLRDLNLPGQSVVIEITEGILMGSNTAVGDVLFNYRDAGVQIAIDDFGTGYSSLSYLNRFNIDYLKIDQSFIRNITPDSNDMALVDAIIVMAHKLGLKVIAEGVEIKEQYDLLSASGCDYAQGSLYSMPVAPEEFEKFFGAELIMNA